MRKIHYFIFFCTLLVSESICNAHHPHDWIFALDVASIQKPENELICGINHLTLNVLSSKYSGETWVPLQAGFTDKSVTALAYSPLYSDDSIIFLGTIDGSIYKYSEGDKWLMVADDLASRVNSFAVSPFFDSDLTVFAATKGRGIYKSINGGLDWTETNSGLTNLQINSLAISPNFAIDRTILAASNQGIFKSSNGGEIWEKLQNAIQASVIKSICLSTNFGNDREIFAGIYGSGVYKSSDGGDTWVAINNGISDLNVTALSVSPNYDNDGTVMAASKDTGVFKTTSGGELWQLMDNGLESRVYMHSDDHFVSIVFSPNYGSDQKVYVGMVEGLFRTDDGGNLWRQLSVYQPLSRSIAVSPNFADDQLVVYSTYGAGVYQSESAGNIWQAANTGLRAHLNGGAFFFSVAFGKDGSLYVIRDGGELYRSLSGGITWDLIGQIGIEGEFYLPSEHGFALSPNFTNDQIMFFGSRPPNKYSLYRSMDGGNSFEVLNIGATHVPSIVFSPNFNSDQSVYAGTELGVFKSTDRGDSWIPKGMDGAMVWCLGITPSGNIFAGTFGQGVFYSSDGGESWHARNDGLPDFNIKDILVSPDYENDSTVFVATYGSGIYKSTDSGVNWHYAGLNGKYINKIETSPSYATDQTIFATGWDGVFRSKNGGENWNFVSTVVRYEESYQSLLFDGEWKLFDNDELSGHFQAYTNNVGSSVTLPFWGSTVTWIGTRGPDQGIAAVYLDGVFQGNVDLSAPTMLYRQSLWQRSFLPFGYHTLTLKVLSSADPGNEVSVDAFDVNLASEVVNDGVDWPGPSIRGKPAYRPGQDGGVYLWKETYDGPYYLRVSGDGPFSVAEIDILTEKPFVNVTAQLMEINDSLSWSENRLTFEGRVTTGQDGIDFVLLPASGALMTLIWNEEPNGRQFYAGSSTVPLVPTGWITKMEELPTPPSFKAGKTLGCFLGSIPGSNTVAIRLNGDGTRHRNKVRLWFSVPHTDVVPIAFGWNDSLMIDEFAVSVDSYVGTWWDGLDVTVTSSSGTQMGFFYQLDGLIQPHLVNPETADLDLPNAFLLPVAEATGVPGYDSTQDKGLFVWKEKGGVWHLRVTAGGDYGRYQGAIVSSSPVVSAQPWRLESNDVLVVSADQKRVDFDLEVWSAGQDGIIKIFIVQLLEKLIDLEWIIFRRWNQN